MDDVPQHTPALCAVDILGAGVDGFAGHFLSRFQDKYPAIVLRVSTPFTQVLAQEAPQPAPLATQFGAITGALRDGSRQRRASRIWGTG